MFAGHTTVLREGLWCKLMHYGIDEMFVMVCVGWYRGMEMRVVINGS